MRRIWLLLAVPAFVAASFAADTTLDTSKDRPAPEQSPAELPAEVSPPTYGPGLVIGKITVVRRNVFDRIDGGPVRFPYSWGNKLHIVTEEDFIRNDLLFREGDPFDPVLMSDSERLLRSRPVFRYVRVLPQAPVDGKVDVLVETDDVWTTSIQLAYGTAGGENFYRVGILENNFLGQGKQVGAFMRQDIDRFTRGFSYRDRQLLGTQWQIFGGYGRDEKGREWEAGTDHPFYSPRVKHSAGGAIRVSDDEGRLFEDGDEAVLFRHRSEDRRAYVSRAQGNNPDRARRWTLAFEEQHDHFDEVRVVLPVTSPLPIADRKIAALMPGFEYRDHDFRRYFGVLTFDRDEDINLGWEWHVEAGPSLKSLGATRDGSLARLQVQKIFGIRDDFLWFNHVDVEGRAESEQVRDGVLRMRSEFFWLEWIEKNQASLRGEWVASHNLDPESQFTLGGENGLRAYEVRKFAGQNSLLFTLENRRVVICDWLRLFSIGWAVFADSGAVWKQHQSLDLSEMKSDVGAGIRFAPSRSVDPSLIRLDLAYALQDNDRSSRLVVNIGADIHFGEKRERKFDQ